MPVVREGPLPHQDRGAELGPAHGPAPPPRAATPGLPLPGRLRMAPDIPAAATATPARTRTIGENRPVNRCHPLPRAGRQARVPRAQQRGVRLAR